jgi:hypothetical protein
MMQYSPPSTIESALNLTKPHDSVSWSQDELNRTNFDVVRAHPASAYHLGLFTISGKWLPNRKRQLDSRRGTSRTSYMEFLVIIF